MGSCRVALVGAGNVAQRHARVLAGFDDVRIVGVTDVLPEAARKLAETHDAPVFPDHAALLAAEPDAVYVCVPPFAHGPVEEALVAAGLPMFVEKPLAADLATAERIADRVARGGVLTSVGHHWRYLEIVTRAREVLDGRQVRLVSGAWLDKVPPVAWWVRRDRSGGPVIEQTAHVLDLIRLLAGEVTEVCAVGDGSPPAVEEADIDAVTAATLRFASGAVGTLASACVLGWKHRAGLEVYADGLAIGIGEDALVVREGDRQQAVAGDPEAGRVAVDRAFIDAVRGIGADIRAPYGEALRTHRLACAVAASAGAGRPVALAATAHA
ncbi:Gfo/Idh/MocA family oxidoreductase [Micromonospora sp. NPDC049679]|uniref:Gfo/Idh/MocA family protein n=1 Tax=Micromonospora sp. NPDC049679 TaxID=3155920 RepID=UPI0033FC0121